MFILMYSVVLTSPSRLIQIYRLSSCHQPRAIIFPPGQVGLPETLRSKCRVPCSCSCSCSRATDRVIRSTLWRALAPVKRTISTKRLFLPLSSGKNSFFNKSRIAYSMTLSPAARHMPRGQRQENKRHQSQCPALGTITSHTSPARNTVYKIVIIATCPATN